MSAYWIGRARVRDPEGMKRYGQLVEQAAAIYGPEALVRTADYHRLEGAPDMDRLVVLRFPSVEAAVGYYNSPEYRIAAKVRQASCDGCELVIARGLD